MLLISDAEARHVLKMPDCIEAMERASAFSARETKRGAISKRSAWCGISSNQQLIYYKSNTGVGIQFAAAGALIYETCKRQGLGRELPSEWFGADLGDWMERGFMPSP